MIGVSMTLHTNAENNLENFDALWSYGDPVIVEQKMQELLPKAEALQDKSLYLQILSQIALAQAMQKKFEEAHNTLDKADVQLTPEYALAHARILLERGRVYQQADDNIEAIKYYEQSYELSKKHNLDFHTINAAHMIAIVAEKTEDKILWNKLALDLARKTVDKRAQDWLGSLYNNLGRNYMDAQQYAQALAMFKEALKCRENEGYAPNIRIAKWQVACALRKLGRLDEAVSILLGLVSEYDAIAKNGNYDVPVIQMFNLMRGWVYEELAEIYYEKSEHEKAKIFAQLAYDELSNDEMMKKKEVHRLERLKEIRELIERQTK